MLAAATCFTKLTTGLALTDTHNGLRAMTRRGASHIKIKQNRMAHASEILHQIAQSGLAYVEVPVTIKYTDYSLAKGQRLSETVTITCSLYLRAPAKSSGVPMKGGAAIAAVSCLKTALSVAR